MANPQVEDGHTKIANEILDALMRVNFSPYERRVLDCILRKTYGWNKKMDRISYTQFEEATGLNRRHVARSLGRLITRNIVRTQGNGYKLEYGLQKDYQLWQTLPVQVTANITSTGNESLPVEAMKLLPVEATIPKIESLPPGTESLPPGTKSLPVEATTSLPKQVTTKAIKHRQKHITKAKAASLSFEEYAESIRSKYPDLSWSHELEKFKLYWDGHDKKHTPQNLKLCLLNWMDRERRWQERNRNGVSEREKSSVEKREKGGSYGRTEKREADAHQRGAEGFGQWEYRESGEESAGNKT